MSWSEAGNYFIGVTSSDTRLNVTVFDIKDTIESDALPVEL